MRSKNSKAFTRSESDHIAAVKSVACVVCDAPPPSSAHHVNQGDHFTTVALCWECHQGKQGIHGDKTMWRIRKLDEWGALNETIRRVMEAN
jgi:hypothetical protein